MTSFGHLICAASPVASSTASATATAATSESSGARRSGGGRSSTETSTDVPGASTQLPPEPPAAGRLVVGRRDRALRIVRPEQELRRLALRLVPSRGSPITRRSSRTAETLYSGVPISESPTSCVSQFTFASAKWSAIQTSPG